MSAALDLHRRDLDAYDAREDECTRFAERAISDQLGAPQFFAWADAGAAGVLIDAVSDDDQFEILQLVVKVLDDTTYRDHPGARRAREVLYADAYSHRQRELRS